MANPVTPACSECGYDRVHADGLCRPCFDWAAGAEDYVPPVHRRWYPPVPRSGTYVELLELLGDPRGSGTYLELEVLLGYDRPTGYRAGGAA